MKTSIYKSVMNTTDNPMCKRYLALDKEFRPGRGINWVIMRQLFDSCTDSELPILEQWIDSLNSALAYKVITRNYEGMKLTKVDRVNHIIINDKDIDYSKPIFVKRILFCGYQDLGNGNQAIPYIPAKIELVQ